MRRIVPNVLALTVRSVPIDAASFASFGDVVAQPPGSPRQEWAKALAHPAPNASMSFSTLNIAPARLPATLNVMERHVHSFQTFIPLDASGYLVCVAPGGADDLPAIEQMRAFIVPAGIAITYYAGTWHHPMMGLDRPAQFATMMWRSGGEDDDEFVDLSHPVHVRGS
ncbi:MAG: ureidoglycolate lyase [Pseudolabrys sp.]|nr:ureidoglycolate lyase [Pseudolabrys sp.]